MQLEIISPEKILYSGKAELVTLPGIAGSFTVLENHAPIISVLKQGKVIYRVSNTNNEVEIESGFVEARQNKVSVCVE
ncbi:MAG: ATP synthase F1 subunit epsilon [Prevotellaceae bacterium]|jgi:F-type H+-transporting ATPase subunit epsilon|nr:ATP synthase F1 subunit epsilon [Prevotellaceae bacterium]